MRRWTTITEGHRHRPEDPGKASEHLKDTGNRGYSVAAVDPPPPTCTHATRKAGEAGYAPAA